MEPGIINPPNPNPTGYLSTGCLIARRYSCPFRGGYLTTEEALELAKLYPNAYVISAQGTRAGDVANIFINEG